MPRLVIISGNLIWSILYSMKVAIILQYDILTDKEKYHFFR